MMKTSIGRLFHHYSSLLPRKAYSVSVLCFHMNARCQHCDVIFANSSCTRKLAQGWYEVRDLFPWEMIIKMVISYLLNVEKIWNSAQINLSSTLNFLPKILFRRNNIHQEIDHWNRHWFGAKWHVTVPNSVAQLNLSYANEYTCNRGNVVKWHTNDTYVKFSSVFSWNCDFEQFL